MYIHVQYVCRECQAYLEGTEVGSETMRADRELRCVVSLREDTLREVVAGGGG